MRIVLFLSLVAIAVSGCSSSSVCMYSVPMQRTIKVRPHNTPTSAKVYSFAGGTKRSAFHNRTVTSNFYDKSERTNSTPKRPSKNTHHANASKKGNLNDAIGVPFKIVGGLLHGIKKANLKLPKLPNIGGINAGKAIKTAIDAAITQVGRLPL